MPTGGCRRTSARAFAEGRDPDNLVSERGSDGVKAWRTQEEKQKKTDAANADLQISHLQILRVLDGRAV